MDSVIFQPVKSCTCMGCHIAPLITTLLLEYKPTINYYMWRYKGKDKYKTFVYYFAGFITMTCIIFGRHLMETPQGPILHKQLHKQ